MKVRQNPLKAVLLLLLLVIVATGCNKVTQIQAQPMDAAEAGADVVTVEIVDFKFEPSTITVAPGTRIVFVNHDSTPHNVVQGTASEVAKANHKPQFESPLLEKGDSWELVLDEVGEYDYACSVAGHYLMGMVGKIVVAEGAATDGGSDVALAAEAGHDAHHHGSVAAKGELPEGMSWTPEGLAVLEPFRVDGRVKEFAIDIQEVQHELIEGVEVTVWAFNGTLPGPLLKVTEGDLVRVHFTNTHHQPHTIHWHGIYVDQKYDGVPHTSLAVMPGETYVYEFEAARAGTFMYHCHVDSYRHIDMGMYGGIVIEPKGEKFWDQEYTLILDDWDSNIEPMALNYEPDHNHFIVNGKAFPAAPTLPIKVGEATLVRLINAGYNNYAMHLHGPHFEVVATDGHPLPMPYSKDTVDIAPGERYDIVIRPTKAGMYPFHAHNIQYVRNNGVYPGGIHLMFDIIDDEAGE